MSPNLPCPEGHVSYLSEMLATNAVTLHLIQDPDCGGFEAFPHGDHFHVGHTSKVEGEACKATSKRPTHWRAVPRNRGQRKG